MNILLFTTLFHAAAATSDQDIAERVATVLVEHRAGARVAIDIDDGVVTLIGSLTDAGQQAKLLAAVEATEGVTGVRDQIDVPTRDLGLDTFTTTRPEVDTLDVDAATEQLRADPRFDAEGIQVVADGKTFVLTGRVSSKRHRKLAARALADLGSVRNELIVVPAVD